MIGKRQVEQLQLNMLGDCGRLLKKTNGSISGFNQVDYRGIISSCNAARIGRWRYAAQRTIRLQCLNNQVSIHKCSKAAHDRGLKFSSTKMNRILQ